MRGRTLSFIATRQDGTRLTELPARRKPFGAQLELLEPLRLVLASQSPRRRDLLLDAGLPHTVRVADVDESILDGETPAPFVRRVSRAKAFGVPCMRGEVVLGADTVVVVAESILGKPRDNDEARRMLRLLSGRSHEVVTGVCLRTERDSISDHETTGVWFGALSDDEIESYVASGEPADKAGAYAIQGIASRYVLRIEGSYSNVVGLPVALVWRHLAEIRSFLF